MTNPAEYSFSDDPALLDRELIYRYLSQESYWSTGIPRNVMERSLENSMCFGVYHATLGQSGFARVITDKATFAYLCDVFIIEQHRGQGLSKRLMQTIMEHPDLQTIKRFHLATRDAHGLYEQFGFEPLKEVHKYMAKLWPDRFKRD
jgi:GNAT superfamily N-acetyltransferase